jgi:hypothetical protein
MEYDCRRVVKELSREEQMPIRESGKMLKNMSALQTDSSPPEQRHSLHELRVVKLKPGASSTSLGDCPFIVDFVPLNHSRPANSHHNHHNP